MNDIRFIWVEYIPLNGKPKACVYNDLPRTTLRHFGVSPKKLRRDYNGPLAIVREKPAPVAFEPWDTRGAH